MPVFMAIRSIPQTFFFPKMEPPIGRREKASPPVLSTLPPGLHGKMRRSFFLASLALAFFLNYALFKWMKWYAPSPRPFVFALMTYTQRPPWRLELQVGEPSEGAPDAAPQRRAVAAPGRERRAERMPVAPVVAVRADRVPDNDLSAPVRLEAPDETPMERSDVDRNLSKPNRQRPVRRRMEAEPEPRQPVFSGASVLVTADSSALPRELAEQRFDGLAEFPVIPDDLKGGLALERGSAAQREDAGFREVEPLEPHAESALPREEVEPVPESGLARRRPAAVTAGRLETPGIRAPVSRREHLVADVGPAPVAFQRGHAEPIRGMAALYPQAGLNAGMVTHSVGVAARINARGVCVGARIVRSSGFPALDQVVLNAVRSAAFRPAVAGGLPVETEEVFDVPVHRR